MSSKAWPFVEAQKILSAVSNKAPEKGYILFETGYGPSGLPHLGTFGEVARTTMVRNALSELSSIPTKLFSFSDDYDGLRKIPDNIPNKDLMRKYLGKPLSAIPDPYEKFESYAENMNNRLKEFLNNFGFEYEFHSATEYYKSGKFDDALRLALERSEQILSVMLPTLGEERQGTYSPFLPIHPETGDVLYVPMVETNVEMGTAKFKLENGEILETSVLGGHCKMQWKADWALRWYTLGVDYEMHGKDLIPTAELSSKICNILGKKAPILLTYELFLDENGQKISKSKGNGISMEDWMKYGPTESVSLYMYQNPHRAKKLCFDVIPRQVDDYITYINKYKAQSKEERFENPAWHIHHGDIPELDLKGISYGLLLNLAAVCNPDDKSILWGFIAKYAPNLTPENAPFLDELAYHAVCYYNDFVKPYKRYKVPDVIEKEWLVQFKLCLGELRASSPEEIQNKIYDLGMSSGVELKDYFKSLYQILLGQEQGPRWGSFIILYGIDNMINLIEEVVAK